MTRAGRLTTIALATLLGSCVSTPENTYSQAEIDLLRETTGHTDLEVVTDPELLAHIEEAVATPVDFHAVIVDENGDPLPDFPVQITLYDQKLSPLAWPYLGWTTYTDIKTDKRGRIAFTGKTGARLAIAVHNADYWVVDQHRTRAVFDYAGALRNADRGTLPTTPETAVTFTLQKIPDEAVASPVDLGSVALPVNETIGLSLYLPRYAVAMKNADFQVNLTRGAMSADGTYDWQLDLAVPGGGVQLAPSLYVEQAPESGYQERLVLGHSATDKRWRDRGEWLLFMRTPRGHYAFLEVSVRTGGRPYLTVTGRVNDTGLRYLE